MIIVRKISSIFILLAIISISSCSTFYSIFRQKSKYYTIEEKKILDETIKASNYNYGYNPDIDLEYFFAYPNDPQNRAKKQSSMNEALKGVDSNDLIGYYEKIYGLKVKTLHKMELLKNKKDWSEYTLVEKYYLPTLDDYIGLIEGQVKARDMVYAKKIDDRKNVIKEAVQDDLIIKDIEEFYEERFYYLDY